MTAPYGLCLPTPEPPQAVVCRCGQVWTVADGEVGPRTRCLACPACGAPDLMLVTAVEGGAR